MADLIERDALLKAYCTDCNQDINKPCPILGRCVEYGLIKNAPAVNRWIPVDAGFPDAFIYVICAGEEGMAILRYNGEVWVDDAGCIYPMSAITHWIPMPEPPEKE